MLTVCVMTNVYNAELTIRSYLDSLVCQTYSDFELLVVDDGSTDRTVEIVEGYSGKLRLRLLCMSHVGLRAARAAGVNEARADIIIILDADEVVEPDCIEQFLGPFADPTVGAVGGRLVPLGEGWIIQGTALVRELKHAMRSDRTGAPRVIAGGCLAVRRAAVEEVGGFTSERQTAEDYDISRKLQKGGWKLVSCSNLIVFHRDPVTLGGVLRRQFAVGKRLLPTAGAGIKVLPKLILVAPIFYILGLAGIIALSMINIWAGLLALALIWIAMMLLFRRTDSTPVQKMLAWIVITFDSFGYTLGVVHSLIEAAIETTIALTPCWTRRRKTPHHWDSE